MTDELTVYGQDLEYANGTSVDTDAIRGRAAGLDSDCAVLESSIRRLLLATDSISSTAVQSPFGNRALESCYTAGLTIRSQITKLTELAEDLRLLATDYDEVEAAAQATILSVYRPPTTGNIFMDIATTTLHMGHVVWIVANDAIDHGQQPIFPTRGGMGLLLNEALWSVTRLNDPIPTVAAFVAHLLGAFGTTAVAHEANRTGTPYYGRSPLGVAAESTIAGVAQNIGDLDPDAGAAPGMIRIDRVTQPDGSIGWVVYIPATQSALYADTASDWHSNFAGAMLGDITATTAAVLSAMRQAGIQPGQPIMLAGHSQGGLSAAAVANEVSGELDVAGVVTFGAPVGLIPLPDGVEMLAVENEQDLVAGLDNVPNEVSSEVVTVSMDLDTASDPAIAAGTNAEVAHGIDTYEHIGGVIDNSDNAAVQDFFDSVGDVLDSDAQAQTYYYQADRT